MERKWLETFYKECGREVSLAYNVLNHSNNWGVTLATAVLATGILGTARIEAGRFILQFPTIIHWYFVIFAWIIMLRFFVRSALGLVNMYRWNELIYASSKVLSLPEGHAYVPILKKNCAKKIESYFYNWKSPRKKKFIIWQNLKLMYFWFFLIILSLFLWGLIRLDRDLFYWLGIGIFIVPTLIEILWFNNGHGFQYQKLDLEKEPKIDDLMQQSFSLIANEPTGLLILGFCQEGPYKHAASLLENSTVKWMPWNYQSADIDPSILPWFVNWQVFHKKSVAFVSWDKNNIKGDAEVIRLGQIDYFQFNGCSLHLTIKLDDFDKRIKRNVIKVQNPKIFCFMHEQSITAS